MSRKSFLLALGIALLLTGSTSATLFLLIRHEPEAYRRATLPPGSVRKQRSQEFYDEFTQLITAVAPGSGRDLDIILTDEQVNSFFVEDFKRSNLDQCLLRENISEPRVLFEPGRVRLAFRYGKGLWSTIISIDFGIWLTEETNVVALELRGLQAGSLPIGAQLFLDNLTEVAEQNGVQVNWYRLPENGNPVALLRFQGDQRETTVQLQTLKVDQGSVVIRGRPLDGSPSRAAALPVDKPLGN